MVLADEPTGNLDSASGRAVVDLFEELHAAGQTIVMITHDMGLADLASRVVQIRDGEIVGDLEAAIHQGGEAGRLDAEAAGEITDFLRQYADRCHHGKEVV